MEATLAPGILLAGRYRIVCKIGEGGYGAVYKAQDEQWHGKRWVAVKVINMAGLSAREKIEVTDTRNREIGLLSRLRFKGLPLIYDHFTDAEHWYVVMEYIEGHTLEELIARRYKDGMPAREVVKIGLKLCDMLDYLHNQNPPIIYRDVKPGNIMRTISGDLYLIDFGIARTYRPGQLKDTMPLGSPGYAAPEQYGKAQTTPQTDIYGLGATLLTLLTGKEPQELRVEDIPLEKEISSRLRRLLARMMNPDPYRRPAGIKEVRVLLQRYDLLREDRLPMRWLLWPAVAVLGLIANMTPVVLVLWGMTLVASGFLPSPFLVPSLLFVLLTCISGSVVYMLRRFRRNMLSDRLPFKKTLLLTIKGVLLAIPLAILVALLLLPCAVALQLGILMLEHVYLSMQQIIALVSSGLILLPFVLFVVIGWFSIKIQKWSRRKARAAVLAGSQQPQQQMQYQMQRYP